MDAAGVLEMPEDGVQAFWARFLRFAAARAMTEPRLYDTMRIGSTPEDNDLGAALILDNRKTATSSRPSEYDGPHPGPPFVGALSIVLDGSGQPVAVVETVEVELRKLGDLDEAFAQEYGEWDQTAETPKSELETYYRTRLTSEGSGGRDLELLCERFRMIYWER